MHEYFCRRLLPVAIVTVAYPHSQSSHRIRACARRRPDVLLHVLCVVFPQLDRVPAVVHFQPNHCRQVRVHVRVWAGAHQAGLLFARGRHSERAPYGGGGPQHARRQRRVRWRSEPNVDCLAHDPLWLVHLCAGNHFVH